MAEEVKHEKFEYEEIKSYLLKLKEEYSNYTSAVNNIDLILKTELNTSSNSALYNEQGNKIMDLWDNYCLKIKNYIYIFESWTDAVAKVYNNNIQFEEGNSDNITIDDIDLNVSPNTYSQEEVSLLAKLLNGDSSVKGTIKDGTETIVIAGITYKIIRDNNGNITKVINTDTKSETIINNNLFEEDIKKNYVEMSEEEWQEYLKTLPEEQRRYAEALSTGALVVNADNVESILDEELNKEQNQAQKIAERNKEPEGSIVVDLTEGDPTSRRYEFATQFADWVNIGSEELTGGSAIFPIAFEYGIETDLENDSYIKMVEDENGKKFELYINGEYVRDIDFSKDKPFKTYMKIWNEVYPNVYQRTYSKEGITAYKSFKKSISANFQEFKETNKFYFNEDKSVYYSGEDGQIHYSDGSILQIYEDDLKWTLNLIFVQFDFKDESAIEDIFMIANGYIEHESVDMSL